MYISPFEKLQRPAKRFRFMYILAVRFHHLGLAGKGLALGSVKEKFEFLEFPNVESDSVKIWIPGNSRMDSVAPPRSKMRANWVLSANRIGRGGGCGICSIPSSIWTTMGMDGLAIISSCEHQHCNIRNIFIPALNIIPNKNPSMLLSLPACES